MRLGRISLLFGFAFLSASVGYSQGPAFEWVVSIGAATTFSGGYGIGHDDLGNVYVAGRFTGTADFDPGPGITSLTSAGALDTYITKVDAAGNLVWARRVGGPNDDYSFDVFVDKSGNVYATGAFVGTADFDPGAGTFNLSSAGSFEDIFVLKLDTDGNLAWARKMGSSDFDFGRSITVSAAGNVFTTGSFRGTVDFDPGAGTSLLTSTSGGNDIFISKLDAAGNFVWAKQLGGTGNDIGYAVTVDAAENVFTTGSFSATADFDPGTSVFNLTGVNNGDIFISKLDGAGNFVWAKGMGGTSSDIGHGIQVDDAGNIYTSGEFHTTVDFDPGPGTANLVSAGFNDAFISKLDANGNYLWAKGIGGTIDDESSGLSLDEYGNVYATGSFQSTVDFDPGPGIFNLTTGGSDGFVVKLDASGDFVWAQAFSTRPEGIDVGSDGSIYTTGYFGGTVDFDTGPGVYNVTGAGSNNTFIHKMSQVPPSPTITSFTPAIGPIGTTVNISGINFSATPANNIVYFGASQAIVTAATTTQLTVTVPVGATFKPITVSVNGLIAYTAMPFTVTFSGGGIIDPCSFAAKVDFTTGLGPSSVSIIDLDGDGKADLAVSNANAGANTVSVLRNTGSGPGNISYAAKIDFISGTGSQPWSVAAGDLNGDGKADLAVANSAGNFVSVFRNTSSGAGNINFAAKVDFATGVRPQSVSIADFDGDGKPDLALANLNSNTISVFRNTSSLGSISFAARVDIATGTAPRSVSIADLDGDGKPELAVVNSSTGSNSVSVIRNTSSIGSISFAAKVDFATGTQPWSISIGDLDGDDKPDLAVTNFNSNTVSLFRNMSSIGAINYAVKVDFATGTSPISVTIGDLDGNGKVDLAVANFGDNTLSLFRNTSSIGSFSLANKFDFASGSGPYLVSIGDLDGDGKADLISPNVSSNTVSIFRNTIGSISLPSITSYTPTSGAIGASITITGTNFDIIPANNIVSFNGIVTPVTASTSTTINTTVPAGATTGKITVTIGCNTATSPTDFVITMTALPTITSFTPTSGSIGTTVTITGTNFSTTPANNTVQFNGTAAVVTASTATSITTSVPTGATTGKISVVVGGSTATSVNDFTVTIVNQPPVINTASATIQLEGTATFNLLELIRDVDDNLVIASLIVWQQPTSGALATINNGILTINYSGISFTGKDQLTIQVCDVFGECAQQILEIDVIGEIEIYNGLSPNNDNLNEVFLIRYIDLIPETQNNKVTIYNRWGSKVFEVGNYNNTTNVFSGLNDNGNELPSGTYFYKIVFNSGRKSEAGYLTLKR